MQKSAEWHCTGLPQQACWFGSEQHIGGGPAQHVSPGPQQMFGPPSTWQAT
jgi:hypothetical protein